MVQCGKKLVDEEEFESFSWKDWRLNLFVIFPAYLFKGLDYVLSKEFWVGISESGALDYLLVFCDSSSLIFCYF